MKTSLNMARESAYSLGQILDTAKSLFDFPDEDSEYMRGVSELIGRLVLDYSGNGDGTGENAEIIRQFLRKK